MRSLLLLGFTVFGTTLLAQDDAFSCLANDPELVSRITNNDPEKLHGLELDRAALDLRTNGFIRDRGQAFVIPVVFHIIHDDGPENISDAQVRDAVRILNEDYNKQNPDWVNVRPQFLDIVADVGITFRLAELDPAGNCTSGITRTVSALTSEGDYEMTQLIQWPRDSYMNVWVARAANGAAGYTNYPWVLNNSPQSDGIVVQATYLGSIGTGSPGRSRVLSHEVGHWLNLPHCWGNSNDPGSEENCDMDDGVADTPLTKGWTACVLSGASCGSNLDNVENYMEYSYCDKMFTNGQADRMIAALTSQVADRADLWQPSNLAQTGVADGPELCATSFEAARAQICAGESISFTDLSYNNVTSRIWEFPGGDPATSSEESPLVQYSEPGTYSVTLTVGDGVTTLSSVQSIGIEVLPFPGTAAPFSEDFEAIDALSGSGWSVDDLQEDGSFEITTSAAYGGTKSTRLSNVPSMDGHMDVLLSPTFDLSNNENVTLSFRHAFARRATFNDDGLAVYISNDCGVTWSLRRQMWAVSTLNTGGTISGTFIPTSDQWAENMITTIGSNYHTEGFRFKFQFTHGGGNDLYLDDINLNGLTVGLDEMNGANGFRIWPNPAQDLATLELALPQGDRVTIEIMDVLGRPMGRILERQVSGGPQRIELPVGELAEGTYWIRVRGDQMDHTYKLVVGLR